VSSTNQFVLHIKHRLQHAPEAIAHFGDRRHRQLSWRSYIKRNSSICLLALDVGSPAQLPVTPVTKVGNGFWCMLQPVLDVIFSSSELNALLTKQCFK